MNIPKNSKTMGIEEIEAIGAKSPETPMPENTDASLQNQPAAMIASILNAIPHAVLVIKNRRILFANHAVEKVFGWRVDELMEQTTRILYRNDQEYEEIVERFMPVMQVQQTHIDEFFCRHKDGRDILCAISVSKSPELFQDDMIVATYEDVTVRKQADEDLKKHLEELVEARTQKLKETNWLLEREISERKTAQVLYKTLAEQSLAAVFIVRNGKFRFLNASAVKSSGYTAKELLGKDAYRLIHPHDQEMARINAKNMLQGKTSAPYEFRAVTKEGQIRWIMQAVAPIDYEGKRAVLGNAMDITDFKQAGEALRESEEKFRNISASAQDAIILTDHEGKISFWNEAAERMFGYSGQEVLGLDCHMLIAPQRYHKLSQEGFPRFQNTGQGFAVGNTLEFKAVRKDGSEFPVELSISSTQLKEKWSAIGIIRDISERKRVEAALRESENRLANIIDFLPDATFVIDLSGKVMAWNRAIEEMTGVSAQYMLGKGNYEYSIPFYGVRRPILIDQIFKPDDVLAQQYAFMQKKRDTLLAEGFVPVRGERRSLWAIASPLYDSHGNIVGAVESIRDITEHKQVEAALRESEDKFRVLSEKSGVGVYLIQNGVFQYVNPKGAQICGYTAEELVHKGSFQDIVAPEDWPSVSENLNKRVAGQADALAFEFRIVKKNKERIHVETHGSRIIYNGQPAVISTIIDISDRKRAERERRHIEKLQGVLEMAGTICHEMNQPMQIISGYSELLLRNSALGVSIRDKLDVIRKQIIRMSEITKKLMLLDKCDTQDYVGFGRIIDIHKNGTDQEQDC